VLPGIERHPRKKLEPSPERPLGLLHRWQDEAVRAGRTITRIAVAFEAGRDGLAQEYEDLRQKLWDFM
jgi:transposase